MNYSNKKYLRKFFWQPFLITYIITIVVVIMTVIIQYNTYDVESSKNICESIGYKASTLTFYRIDCPSYPLLTLARVAESLVPTTITFGLTLFISESRKEFDDGFITLFFIGMASISLMALTLPSTKTPWLFWTLTVLVYVLTILVIFALNRMFAIPSFEKGERKSKTEKSDGRLAA